MPIAVFNATLRLSVTTLVNYLVWRLLMKLEIQFISKIARSFPASSTHTRMHSNV